MDVKLVEFEKLLVYLEDASDPWYYEKRQSKLRELNTFQITLCPCNLHNKYGDYYNYKDDTKNLPKLVELLKRANKFKPYRANGTTFYSNDGNKRIEHYPPIHADDCACDPPEEHKMSNKMGIFTIERYKRCLYNMYKEVRSNI